MNKVILCGRTTDNIKNIKTTANGKRYGFVDIAVQQNKDDTATFISLQVWEKHLEVFEKYVGKGSLILVEGNLQSYLNKDKIKQTNVLVKKIEFCNLKEPNSKEALKVDDLTNMEFNMVGSK